MQAPSIEYRVSIGEDLWFPAADLTGADVLEIWIGEPRITCCTIQGGFAIRVDGQPWNEDSLDEVTMSTTWLGATLSVLGRETTAQVWAWEESRMTLVRRGEELELSDIHHSGHVVSPRIVVPLYDFARELATAARAAGALFDEVLLLSADLAAPVRAVIEDNVRFPWVETARKIEDAVALAQPRPRYPKR